MEARQEEESIPPVRDDKNNNVTLGEALASPGMGAHPQSVGDTKWH